MEGTSRAGVPWLRTGTQGCGEVQSEVDSIAHLLGGAGRQLEQVLVVRKDVVEGRVVLVANILEILMIKIKLRYFNVFNAGEIS